MTNAVYLNHLGALCSAGRGHAALREALFAPPAPIRRPGLALPDGRVWPSAPYQQALPDVDWLPLPLRSRNNALLLAALEDIRAEVDAAIARFGPDRVGVVLGTSTSGIGESEAAFAALRRDGRFPAGFHPLQQELGSPAALLRHALGIGGPALVISTACSSGAKALASAARLLRSGQCDAVIAGGADSLCQFTVAGFAALDSVSATGCNPFSRNRDGIHIGEAAALFLMSRERGPVRLAGWGESADAHHISAPDPSGRGAAAAMRQALERAGLAPADIDYINLHGTATQQNDAMESLAVSQLFGATVPASSTKGLTGHTLGAAGALEAAFAWLTLHGNPAARLPVHVWDGAPDAALRPLNLVRPGQAAATPPRRALSNSFAFGGSNACLILEAAQ
ncbi:beta-ketoacyl-ACP synthase [Chromobacterium subtsugae]|uniref:Beta-ketoacyl-ACP synthase n=1 Tax=Chromobacterium subtsugae TaxID=251747 RepID=A0ABS7FCS7_9NEIS|nr:MULTISPECIES: beta-ketoacyl-ACP synthase [Chromobacterium]KUM03219.1 3-oxoacyl-ACP synthase [Chromobacterium subtsugae]KZE88262.1 3-oxoacyl-ACP synthase [Chromobacterium sp. F49]MBW7565557.1 beta-ketoacyl-ACP synthase [Chromobacterium subtsugae]MBW8287886.1 beta-ketoacyl-ACP synthase [Chromobacterium subtsugae]WSE89653.1 beta-ketoacyl-ACP synthase [Chromobacterium subtsugae]